MTPWYNLPYFLSCCYLCRAFLHSNAGGQNLVASTLSNETQFGDNLKYIQTSSKKQQDISLPNVSDMWDQGGNRLQDAWSWISQKLISKLLVSGNILSTVGSVFCFPSQLAALEVQSTGATFLCLCFSFSDAQFSCDSSDCSCLKMYTFIWLFWNMS